MSVRANLTLTLTVMTFITSTTHRPLYPSFTDRTTTSRWCLSPASQTSGTLRLVERTHTCTHANTCARGNAHLRACPNPCTFTSLSLLPSASPSHVPSALLSAASSITSSPSPSSSSQAAVSEEEGRRKAEELSQKHLITVEYFEVGRPPYLVISDVLFRLAGGWDNACARYWILFMVLIHQFVIG